MAGEDTDFDALLRRVRAGDPEAARELYERYSDDIRRAVRHRLHRRLRAQFDSLDFVQSVWASFIQIPADRCTFENEDDLLGYLARMAYNKVIDVYRQRMEGQVRDARREVSLEAANAEEPLPAPDPRPSQVFVAEERWERLLAEQEPQFRRILELKRLGYSHEEISEEMRLNLKFIQRFLRKLEGRLDRS
jgi:RNA polymerase sigma factor (sigma-70 family)